MAVVHSDALDEIIPFAFIVTADGQSLHIGRTIRKALNLSEACQPNFFDIFDFSAPRRMVGNQDLHLACGKRISLKTKGGEDGASLELRASVARSHPTRKEFIILTSLGRRMPELIERLQLSDRDFAHADASIDLFYFLNTQSELLRDTQTMAERLREAKELAEAQAHTDTLTGLPNRRALTAYAECLLGKPGSERGNVFLLHVDLDRFKQVNDSLGHAAGDAILRRVTSDLLAASDDDGLVARIGGDEFVLIATRFQSEDQVEAMAEDLIASISAPLKVNGMQAKVGASIGITLIRPGSTKSIDTFLLEADLALYDVKNSGRGAVKVFCGEMLDREAVVQELIRDIEPAIANGEFVPYFQLQTDTKSQQIFGAEVLGRWLHPKYGVIGPTEYLYIAARAKLTEKIDLSIYSQALNLFAKWQSEGIAPPHISLNLTGRMLTDQKFLGWIQNALTTRGLAPGDVIFELVETILLDGETDDVQQATLGLANAGFTLAIDDFGTGRASLTSLISVPVGLVKIDRAFVSNVHRDEKLELLTKAIIDIAHSLGLNILAEGVETFDECSAIEQMGCTVFQGFLFGHPVPATTFTETLRDENWLQVAQEVANRKIDRESA